MMRHPTTLLQKTPAFLTQTLRATCLLITLTACGTSHSAHSDKSSESSPVISDRPRVAQSAAELAPGGGSDQLDFFDELEHHELATQDDALHAVLLAFHGSSTPTYVQRAAIAKQLGLMNPRNNPQPREAVTVGEVSQLLSRSLSSDLPDVDSRTASRSQTSQQAMESMQKLGILPREWRTARGMTGPELLAAIKNAGHVMDERGHAAAGKE